MITMNGQLIIKYFTSFINKDYVVYISFFSDILVAEPYLSAAHGNNLLLVYIASAPG